MSRHPVEDEEIFEEDYGISGLFEGELPFTEQIPVSKSIVGAIITNTVHNTQEENENENNIVFEGQNFQNIESIAENVLLDRYTVPEHSIQPHFNMEAIRKAQAEDSVIQRKRKETEKGDSKGCYEIQDEILYRIIKKYFDKSTTERSVIYLPSSMIEQILTMYHSSPIAGHFGIRRTYCKIVNHYWWPNMKKDIQRFIKSCLSCQQFNIDREKRPGHLCLMKTSEGPFQIIGIDFCGPLQPTPRGNQYVLVITDYFTRWVTTAAVSTASATSAAETIFTEYICKYGIPLCVLSDQGTHFRNQLMDAMAKLMGYTQIFSTAYHPQSNGIVERFNATFLPQISKLQDGYNNNWDDYLAAVTFGYNTGQHSTTGFSPFHLLFGCEPRLPADPPIENYVFHRPVDYFKQLKTNLTLIRRIARDSTNKKRLVYKKHYDQARRNPKYSVGTHILVRKHGARSKLEPRYSIDIYTVKKNNHPIYIVHDEKNDITRQVHVNDMRPIISD